MRHVRLGGPSITAAVRRRIGRDDGFSFSFSFLAAAAAVPSVLSLSSSLEAKEEEGGEEDDGEIGMFMTPWACERPKMERGISCVIWDVLGGEGDCAEEEEEEDDDDGDRDGDGDGNCSGVEISLL